MIMKFIKEKLESWTARGSKGLQGKCRKVFVSRSLELFRRWLTRLAVRNLENGLGDDLVRQRSSGEVSMGLGQQIFEIISGRSTRLAVRNLGNGLSDDRVKHRSSGEVSKGLGSRSSKLFRDDRRDWRWEMSETDWVMNGDRKGLPAKCRMVFVSRSSK